jgi:hypothetical protein
MVGQDENLKTPVPESYSNKDVCNPYWMFLSFGVRSSGTSRISNGPDV